MFASDRHSPPTPRSGPAVLGPWRTAPRPARRKAILATGAVTAAAAFVHCILPLI